MPPEGFKKVGSRDKANFYNIAQGSLEELRYYLMPAQNGCTDWRKRKSGLWKDESSVGGSGSPLSARIERNWYNQRRNDER